MKITVLDAGTLGSDVNLTPFYEVGEVELFENTAPDEIAARIKESDVVCINKIKLNEGNLSGSAVRVICVAATGYDNIDTVYCKKQGIAVCNVPGYSTHSVAQLSVAMALYLVNHLSEYRSFVHSGEYSRSGVANRLTPVWHELYGQTWGIVGGGNIGGQVARVAEAFGCRVLVCRRKKDPHFETVDIDTLCRESDIISLHVPLSEETRGMISAERIAMMNFDEDDALHLYWRVSDTRVCDGGKVKLENGSPITSYSARTPRYGARGRCKLSLVDWDGDGVLDLLIGTPRSASIPTPERGLPNGALKPIDGLQVLWMKNVGTNEAPVFREPEQFRFQGKDFFIGQHANSPTPCMLGDTSSGMNLLVGCESGRFYFFERKDLTTITIDERNKEQR